jgi:Icc-related predicted phosphoesterase
MGFSFSGMIADITERCKYFFTRNTNIFIDHTLKCTVSREIKLGVVSDIEGAIDEAKKSALKLKQEDVEAIIIAGDNYENELIRHNPMFHEPNKLKQMKQGILPYVELDIPVYIIPGNHESSVIYKKAIREIRKIHKNLIDIHMKTIKKKDFAIVGFGGCFDFMITDPEGVVPGQKEYKKVKVMLQKVTKKPLLFVTHVPPKSRENIDFVPGYDHVGDSEIRKLMTCTKNIVNIHGHIHEQGGQFSYYKTNIAINVASITPFHNYRGSNTAILRMFNNKVLYEEI